MSRVDAEPDPKRTMEEYRGNQKVVGGVTLYALDGDKWKTGKAMFKTRKGGSGIGIGYSNAMYTLSTMDRHIVADCRESGAFRPAYVRRVCDGRDGSLICFESRGLN